VTGPPEDATSLRRRRHRDELASLLGCGQLHRAADLAMEHLSEFPDDVAVRVAVTAALLASDDPHLCRRAVHLAPRRE
jgi:hypothetical protein